jgi:hypothetical protein
MRSPATKEKFDAALRDIVLARLEASGPAAAAAAAAPAASDRRAPDMALADDWSANRVTLVFRYARDVVDGRTAREIIVIAEKERKRAAEAALAVHRDQLARARAALELIDREEEAAARQGELGRFLRGIEIAKPRFGFEEVGMLDQPTVSFSVANNGSVPVKRIFVRARVEAPGRDAPLIETEIDHSLPGGLRPGETKEVSLAPNMFSEWGTVPREALKEAVLRLKLMAFDDVAEKRYAETAPWRDEWKRRRKAAEDGIRRLEQKIQGLQAQLGD